MGDFQGNPSVYENEFMTTGSPGADNAAAGSLARIATSTFFFVFGFLFASWITHIPTIKQQLEISASQLGMALLAIAIGALISMSCTGVLIPRWGSRRITAIGTLLGGTLMAMPVMMPSYTLLIIAFAAMGAANGAAVVAMNAQGVIVEKHLGKFIMSSLHAMFSIGGLTGSLFAVALLSLGVSPRAHTLTAVIIGLILVLAVKRFLLPERAAAGNGDKPSRFSPRPHLLLLGMLTFAALMTEGAIADWSALYLRQVLEVKPEMAGLGYAGFSLAMAAGRLAGDRLVAAFGRGALLQTGGALASLGFAMILLFEHYLLAVAGFVCVGLGVSNIIPLLYGAAGNLKDVSSSAGLATVTTTGHFGFLVGPPLIGFLADWIGLRLAFGIFVVFMAFIACLGKWVERQTN